MPSDETTRLNGIPITTAARTIIDLAAEISAAELEQAVAQTLRAHRTTHRQLVSLLDRHSGRPGTRALRALLDRDSHPALTRSRAERRFLALIRRAGLPAPDANFQTGRYELDFYWPAHRLAVEIDDFHTHGSPASFKGDRRRDAELAVEGIQVLRITRAQIAGEPERTLSLIAQALTLRHPSGGS